MLIGEFDDPNALLHPSGQRKQRNRLQGRRIRHDRDQRLDVAKA